LRKRSLAIMGVALATMCWAPGAAAQDESDFIPPDLTVPAQVVFNATGPTGATVIYAVSATDNVDPNPKVDCSPPSGTVFPIGTTIVTCTATDASGNTATKSFDVVVKGAEDQVLELRTDLVEVKEAAARPLRAQLTAVQTAIEANRARSGCGPLGAFLDFVSAQSGKGLTEGQASNLIVGGTRVSAVLNC
jgi:HYR domain